MEQEEIEMVGKVFVVVGGKRKCLVCEGVFTPIQAANHAATICSPTDCSVLFLSAGARLTS